MRTSSCCSCYVPYLFRNLFRPLSPLFPEASLHLKTRCDDGVHTCDEGNKAVGELNEERQGVERDCAAGGKADSEDCSEGSNDKGCRDRSMQVHILPFALL